jgi:preprotein translocase subunit SecE
MINKIIQYFKDSRQELKKVVWPTRKEAFNLTMLVILISLGVAFLLGAIDAILIFVVSKFIS